LEGLLLDDLVEAFPLVWAWQHYRQPLLVLMDIEPAARLFPR
jgi:hypothetical protein